MKRTLIIASSLCMAALLQSCSKNMESNIAEGNEAREITITATLGPETRLGVTDNGTGGRSLVWEPGDAISLFFNSGTNGGSKFTTDADSPIATFTGVLNSASGDLSGIGDHVYFWAVHPYGKNVSCDATSVTTTLPAKQNAIAGDVADDLIVTAGRSENLAIHFKNTLTLIGFTVSNNDIAKVVFSGNAGEPLAGEYKISFDGSNNVLSAGTENAASEIEIVPAEGYCFEPNTTYYFAMLPSQMSSGYKMRFIKNNGTFADYTRSTAVNFAVGKFYTMTAKDSGLEYQEIPAADLSLNGTANCYIVNEVGIYQFRTVKGNSSTSVGTVATAEVLWESFGSGVTPNVGDLVSIVSCNSGYIKFAAGARKGNAVIAAKDASGTILWSWHIWLTDQPVDQVYYNDAGTFMDRNLGATSATPDAPATIGLLYQFGRKDPFLGSSSFDEAVESASTITWPEYVKSTSSTGTIPYTIAHPTTFIGGCSTTGEWYYGTTMASHPNNRWINTSDQSKTIYDPCPHGYRVPYKKSGDGTTWSVALNRGTSETAFVTAGVNGFNGGSSSSISISSQMGEDEIIWYPFGGYRKTTGLAMDSAYYWTGRYRQDQVGIGFFGLRGVRSEGKLYTNYFFSSTTSTACSVRCVKE